MILKNFFRINILSILTLENQKQVWIIVLQKLWVEKKKVKIKIVAFKFL
jgi:hypothetical protein